jgi:hypothetical protein
MERARMTDPAGGGSVLGAVLERITFVNEETGYTVARVAADRSGPDLITVTGALLGTQVGERLRLTGRWASHPTKWGGCVTGSSRPVRKVTTHQPPSVEFPQVNPLFCRSVGWLAAPVGVGGGHQRGDGGLAGLDVLLQG